MKSKLSASETTEFLSVLQQRFEENMHRHADANWAEVKVKLEINTDKIVSLFNMEATGGEPDVVSLKSEKDKLLFMDCSAESPAGRRSFCYDRAALDGRKENKPKNSALDMAREIGIDILTEEQYYHLQQSGKFDTKTSSWVLTPQEIRKHGGALFCDRRYEHVFTYHNGAESYYAARGFRGILLI